MPEHRFVDKWQACQTRGALGVLQVAAAIRLRIPSTCARRHVLYQLDI